MTPTTPEQEQVEAIKSALIADLAGLQQVEDQAAETLKRRRAETASAEREVARFERAAALANANAVETARLLKSAEVTAVLKTIESAANGELDFGSFDQPDELERQLQHEHRFIDRLHREFIPEAREQRLFALEAEAEAEAALIESEVAIRDYKFRLNLAPLAEMEGEVRIDDSVGITAGLRKKAAEIRLRANSIHQQIVEGQQVRKNREIEEKRIGL
jgi:hypothetical protein